MDSIDESFYALLDQISCLEADGKTRVTPDLAARVAALEARLDAKDQKERLTASLVGELGRAGYFPAFPCS